MTTEATAAATPTVAELSPGVVGRLTGLIGRILKSDPVAAREILQDAGVSAAVAKATGDADALLRGGSESVTGIVEDHWDGAPDDRLMTVRTGGPGSTAPSGAVPLGSPQEASGGGAPKMVSEYSRTAPQGGVQAATERLGREMGRMRGSQKAILEVVKAQTTQIEVLKSTVVALMEHNEAASKSISEAVAKAIAEVTKAVPGVSVKSTETIVVKAEDDKKDEKKDDEKEVEKSFRHHEAEDETEASSEADEKTKSKSFVGKAKDAVRKALDADLSGDAGNASRWYALARSRLAKATKFDASEETAKAVMAVAKALPKAKDQNQTTWPASEEKPVGSAKAEEPKVDIAKAIEEIQRANAGMAMFQTTIGEFMKVVSGQSRNGSGLPPVFELVKSEVGLNAKAAEINTLAQSGAVNRTDADAAHDVLMQAVACSKGEMDDRFVKARIDRLHPLLRNVFVPAEAAA